MKGLESYNEKRKSSLCNESDVQSSNFDEETVKSVMNERKLLAKLQHP